MYEEFEDEQDYINGDHEGLDAEGLDDQAQILAALGDDGGLGDDESLGGLFSWVSSAANVVAKATAVIVHSPITKVVVGGVAIVVPAVGVPAMAGLVMADKLMRTAEGARGTPAQRTAVIKAVKNTVKAAASGDQGAKRALEFMALAKRVRETQHAAALRAPNALRGKRHTGPLVDDKGRIHRGVWVRVG